MREEDELRDEEAKLAAMQKKKDLEDAHVAKYGELNSK